MKETIPYKSRFRSSLDAVEEFEFTPVPTSKLKSFKSFAGQYLSEHTAGTEFVIGPLFVAHGVTAGELVWGLIIGNLLAVLSWTLVCAPVATKYRLTLYAMVEKIGGKHFSRIYNVVNALMFSSLAGAMITVSATALGIPFQMNMPSLEDWLPISVGWCILVLVIGLFTTLVAMFGYQQINKFANIAAPWMILVFLAAALNVLPQLGITSLSELWASASTEIWTGRVMEGQSVFTFWHVMFFSWFVNIGMHLGMADLSILRYAKNYKAGFATSTGMFLGHFVAWLCSGILYALFLKQTAFSTEFAPGPVAFAAAGTTGALCVFIAGLTTANPTIYRAGLAIQALNPAWKTWKVTLVIGLFTTLIALFPAIVMQFLEFIALYGLSIMPIGGIILVDVVFLPRLGYASFFAETFGKSLSKHALFTWLTTLLFCRSSLFRRHGNFLFRLTRVVICMFSLFTEQFAIPTQK
jgi:purine-cytosine permease-like protein